ncbi:MAG: hypothetical protein ABIQ54_03445, partial [Gammaproteobacteria bacterium]
EAATRLSFPSGHAASLFSCSLLRLHRAHRCLVRVAALHSTGVVRRDGCIIPVPAWPETQLRMAVAQAK